MLRTKIVPIVMAAVIAVGSTVGVAAEQNSGGKAIQSEYALKSAVSAFEKAKITIANAISIAERHGSGGKTIDVVFDLNKGAPVYKVKTYQNNAVWEGMIDAQSGKVVGAGTTTPEDKLDQEDKAELAGLQKATMTLAQAIEAAEKYGTGKAMSAGLEETKGKIVYEVTVVKSGSVRKLVVDPNGGQIISG